MGEGSEERGVRGEDVGRVEEGCCFVVDAGAGA